MRKSPAELLVMNKADACDLPIEAREANLRPVLQWPGSPTACLFQVFETCFFEMMSFQDFYLCPSPGRSPLQYKKSRSRASCTTQSRPFFRLSPVMALHGITTHRWVRIRSSSSNCVASCSVMPPAISVLFKKTSKLAPPSLFMPLANLSMVPEINLPPRAAVP